EDRALGFEKVALTTATIQLPPRTTARMAIRADIAEPEPAAIPTVGIGTEMVRGVNVAPAATCRAKGPWRGAGRLPVRCDALCTCLTGGFKAEAVYPQRSEHSN